MKITVRPRLHVGLISMHAGGYRKNGGIGFSINDPSATIEIETSTKFYFQDLRKNPFSKTEIDQIANVTNASVKMFALNSNIAVTLYGELRTHVGFGSGTAIRLAVLEGLFLLNGRNLSRIELVRQSLRGGTSGIGINTYFSGGLVFDLGVPNDHKPFTPSSQNFPDNLPPSLPTLKMPAWPMCACVPRFIKSKTQDDEVDFFKRAAPVNVEESYKVLYHALFGAYAAVMDNDFLSFCDAIEAIQATMWKKLEWLEYGDLLRKLATRLRDHGANAVGMSSLGPMLYCLGNKDAIDQIAQQSEDLNCDIFQTLSSNTGRTLENR